jgi:hypothetical protein
MPEIMSISCHAAMQHLQGRHAGRPLAVPQAPHYLAGMQRKCRAVEQF